MNTSLVVGGDGAAGKDRSHDARMVNGDVVERVLTDGVCFYYAYFVAETRFPSSTPRRSLNLLSLLRLL